MAEVTLLTNGGAHPPDKWAIVTADKIAALISIDESSLSSESSVARKDRRRFSVDVSDALEAVFAAVGDGERAAVISGKITKRHDPFDVEVAADEALSIIGEIANKTVFSGLLATDEAKLLVRNILKQNLIDAANIARSWAFDAKGL